MVSALTAKHRVLAGGQEAEGRAVEAHKTEGGLVEEGVEGAGGSLHCDPVLRLFPLECQRSSTSSSSSSSAVLARGRCQGCCRPEGRGIVIGWAVEEEGALGASVERVSPLSVVMLPPLEGY